MAIIGIQWYRGQMGSKNDKVPEEEAAVDEIPPVADENDIADEIPKSA